MNPNRSAEAENDQPLRVFHVLGMIFGVTLVVSDVVSVKLVEVGSLTLPAGIIIFPLSYILGDVLTEVYGFRRTRSIIWWGLAVQLMAAIFFWLAVVMPPASFWSAQAAFSSILGFVPRIVAASLVAYFFGEFINSVIMSCLKVRSGGRHFWWRALASTLLGQGVDSFLFNTLAFGGTVPSTVLLALVLSGWITKVLFEILVLPFTYSLAKRLKKIEGLDHFDTNVRYTLFGEQLR